MSFANKIVCDIRSALLSADLEGSAEAIAEGITNCTKGLKTLNAALSTSTEVSQKQHLITAIGHVKRFKEMFKALRVVGEGYNPRPETATNRVKWVDIQASFRSR